MSVLDAKPITETLDHAIVLAELFRYVLDAFPSGKGDVKNTFMTELFDELQGEPLIQGLALFQDTTIIGDP